MKKNNSIPIFAVIFFAAVTFSACEKDDTGIPEVFKVKTHNSFNYLYGEQLTGTYTYDEQGRVTEIAYSGGPNRITSYTYSANTVTRQRGTDSYTNTFSLNEEGNAVSITQTDSAGNIMWTQSRVYDAEGYLISDGFATYVWEAGNRVMTIFPGDTTRYTYLSDKDNTIGTDNTGFYFVGKDSKNLIAQVITQGDTITHSYEYDAQGRVTKLVGSEMETFTYY